MKRQQGAFLAIMAVLIIALLGFSALAIDVGRVLVLRSEIQNAADAAALAAAFELNTEANAIERAKLSARNALVHNSHFARVRELLNDDTLPDEAFVFFCVIGSRHDVDASDANVDLSHFCGNITPYGTGGADASKYEASGDTDAHYVRVRLAASDAAADNFTLDLIFYPVIRLLGAENVITELSLEATALAGRNFYSCNTPPLAICDPFEASGQTFRDAMPVGGHITLKQQGSNQWTNGNFGFLEVNGGPGGASLAEFLADEGLLGCVPAFVTTQPGGVTQKAKSAINTRFGIYGNNDDNYGNTYSPAVSPFNRASAPVDYPPAPHVGSFPDDLTHLGSDSRFGTGNWNCNAYWASTHGGAPIACTPGVTRWDVYNYEIANGLLTPDMVDEHTAGTLDRRQFHVSVLSCAALGLTGGKTSTVVFQPDGFAKIFLTAPATSPPNAEMYGEYIGWGNEDDATFHIDIQLYE
ncbi:pilus assembly protein TadG-related protein [Litorivivens sp.]|uniref:pilus assembly protein TadG-related protein n=1 Tax=Litorivivens sp. TaxID=2020868 RepID=UPI0035643ACE